MASQVSGYIGRIDPGNGTNYAIGATAYGYCQTAADVQAKVVDMTGFKLVTGATIFVKFQYSNSAENPTLNVNGTGAKPMYRYGTTVVGTASSSSGWPANAVLALTYDGAGWIEHFWYNTTYTIYGAYCLTASETAAKTATCSYYQLAKGYLEVTMRYDNTYEGAITLNVASKGAKPIYINGTASSADNYTLPGGVYLVYYDGSRYHFRTDGLITGSITGNATTANASVHNLLTNENLNTIMPAEATWYYAVGQNSVTNTPEALTDGRAFGMLVFRIASGYRTQILFTPDNDWYMRNSGANNAWTAWKKMEFTDTITTATVSNEALTITTM